MGVWKLGGGDPCSSKAARLLKCEAIFFGDDTVNKTYVQYLRDYWLNADFSSFLPVVRVESQA